VEPDLIIVGRGLTGLTAAIEAAERGRRVTVAEAHSRLGGRARSLAAPFRANTGPHAIYVDGPWWPWLERRGLTPPIVEAPRDAGLVRAAGRLGPWPAELSGAIAALPAEAPAEESFRAWLLRHVDAKTAEAIVGLVFIPTFDHDPGRLSAAFARQRLRRALAGGARYVVGGWSTLVGLLADRAASLGAQIRTQTRVPALPAGPTILATSLATARQLTGDRSLTWPSARVATVDLGLRADASPGWFRVMDLDHRNTPPATALPTPPWPRPGMNSSRSPPHAPQTSGKPTPNAACSVFLTSPGAAGAARCSGTAAPCAQTAPGP
jgi:phytoene dehydrogenase-like protein